MSIETHNGARHRLFIKGHSCPPEPKSYRGLDLGQRHDHSALAELELTWTYGGLCPVTFAALYQPEVAITRLQRFPLTTGYEEIYTLVTASLARRPHAQELVIDAGGPGAPMVDRLRHTLPSNISVCPVLLTSGAGQNSLSGGYTAIPRRTLITNLLLTISARSLACDAGTPNWDAFVDELIELRADTYHPATAGGHDDLVIAVALALSAAVRDTPELLPHAGPGHPGDEPRFGFIDKPLF